MNGLSVSPLAWLLHARTVSTERERHDAARRSLQGKGGSAAERAARRAACLLPNARGRRHLAPSTLAGEAMLLMDGTSNATHTGRGPRKALERSAAGGRPMRPTSCPLSAMQTGLGYQKAASAAVSRRTRSEHCADGGRLVGPVYCTVPYPAPAFIRKPSRDADEDNPGLSQDGDILRISQDSEIWRG